MRRLAVLQAIIDVDSAARAGWRPDDLARAYLSGGATFLQLRAKTLPSGALLELAERLVELAQPFGAEVIVNDRADVARMCRAAGVHVGQEDLPPGDARALVGADAIVGLSTHTAEQVEAALAEPVTYVAVGPVFGTQTKDTGYSAIGLELVRRAAHLAAGRLPIVAIGGITIATAGAVIDAGAAGVAVIGDLLAEDPAARVREYLRRLERGTER